MTDIVIVQASHVLTNAEIQTAIKALQKWDDNFLRPAWGLDKATYDFATMAQFEAGSTAGAWPVFANNHSHDPGALGWHDKAPDGQPFGRVFVGDCKRYGISWTVDLSHEAAEMRVDPEIDNFFTLANGWVVLREVGDAVESDENGIVVDSTLLTDFVLPDYFSTKTGVKFDYQGKLHGHCPTLTPGGYMGVFKDGQWGQVTMNMMGPASYRSIRFHNSHRGLSLPIIPELYAFGVDI